MGRRARAGLAFARRLAHQPLFHFLALGGLLFAADQLLSSVAGPAVETVVVEDSQLRRLRHDWRERTGRWPTPRQLRGLVDDWVTEELLYREARRRGLDRQDLVVRRRLTAKMRFLSDDPQPPAGELYRQALALGLDRDDVIVRRRLVHRMRLLAAAEGGPVVRPGEAEMRDYVERHRQRFEQPARVRLSHLFLNRDRRRNPREDAASLLDTVRRLAMGPEEAVALGDAFLLGHHLPPRSAGQLRRSLGPGFAEAVADLERETWSEPIASPYGLHLVWVHEKYPTTLSDLDDVRGKVLRGLLDERREARFGSFVEDLRRRYPVVVGSPGPQPEGND